MENLLTGFLSGALCVELIDRLENFEVLPSVCRRHSQAAEGSGGAWIAWSTASGPMVAWGSVDIHGSKRINAYLLQVAWCDALSGYHSLWCYCDPKHPTEWTIGRGRRNEAR
jgi:hypothetical protein